MIWLRAGLGALLLLLCAGGCAVSPNSNIEEFAAQSGRNSFEVFDREITSPDTLVLPVEHDRQYAGPSCGAHALASVINYWNGAGAVQGAAIFRDRPPASPSGYSMAEIMQLARDNGLIASGVRLDQAQIIQELERGRPVLVPVRLPSIYVQQRVMPGGDVPVLGIVRNTLMYRAGRVSELTSLAMVDHYLLVVGHGNGHFVVIEPVMGYRTISFIKLERYRDAFGDAAIVFSGQHPPRANAQQS